MGVLGGEASSVRFAVDEVALLLAVGAAQEFGGFVVDVWEAGCALGVG